MIAFFAFAAMFPTEFKRFCAAGGLNGIGDYAAQRAIDTCLHCHLPILPGETHGEVVPRDADAIPGPPLIRCRILKLQQVEEIVETSGR